MITNARKANNQSLITQTFMCVIFLHKNPNCSSHVSRKKKSLASMSTAYLDHNVVKSHWAWVGWLGLKTMWVISPGSLSWNWSRGQASVNVSSWGFIIGKVKDAVRLACQMRRFFIDVFGTEVRRKGSGLCTPLNRLLGYTRSHMTWPQQQGK